jgi:S1-C subfamily serine protease
VPGSEAARSGIEAGDILVRIDDTDINNVRDLIKVINKHKAGDSVVMEVYKGRERVRLKTVLEKAPSMRREVPV